MKFQAEVNGRALRAEHEPYEFLTELLRREGFMGTKRGCETGDCGTCSVLLEGREINSCILLAAQANGHSITTIEGLGDFESPHPIQEAFVDLGAVQCGFCTPGMVIATKALIDEHPDPSEADARACLAGHLCRCTGYTKPIQAVLESARRLAVIEEARSGS